MAKKKATKPKGKRITTKQVQNSELNPIRELPEIQFKAEEDTDAFGADELTPRQRRFVDAMVGPAGGNASKAAEMAGYASENRNSLAVTASRLLRNANVQRAMGLAYAKLRQTPEWAEGRLVEIASSNIANVTTIDDDGNLHFDAKVAIANGALGQIKEFREESIKVGGSAATVIKQTVKMHDPSPALSTMLKLYGKLIERRDVTSGGKPIKAFADIDDGDEAPAA